MQRMQHHTPTSRRWFLHNCERRSQCVLRSPVNWLTLSRRTKHDSLDSHCPVHQQGLNWFRSWAVCKTNINGEEGESRWARYGEVEWVLELAFCSILYDLFQTENSSVHKSVLDWLKGIWTRSGLTVQYLVFVLYFLFWVVCARLACLTLPSVFHPILNCVWYLITSIW